MTITRNLSSVLQTDLRSEQFRILRTQIPILYAVLAINVGILAFSVYGSVVWQLSLGIPGLFAMLIMVRSSLWLRRRWRQPTEILIARYLRTTPIVAGAISLGLGSWGVVLLNSDVGDKPFVPLFIGFGAIASAYCLASLPRAAFATVVLATTPVIATLLTSGVRVQAAAGLNLLLIFLLVLRLVVHQHKYLLDMVISHAEVKALAYTDPLTGLANRRAFIESLEGAVSGSQGKSTRAAVVMIDLDGLKIVNDTYGHAAGDAVLLQAAERIQAVCRDCHLVARLGGDEFAVLLVGMDGALATDLGRKLVAAMSETFTAGGTQLRLSASVGLAGHDEGDVPILVMSRADTALYEVKRAGGGDVRLFTPVMGLRLRRHNAIQQALRATDPPPAIEVVYQPIFDARTRRIATFEALARWHHPQLGRISPMDFITVAEQNGTIAALSEQIFATAIEQAASWAAPVGLSINLSAVDLVRPSTRMMIMSLCERYGFDPRRMEVEVTETSVLADFSAARRQLDLLRASGIQIALDDFGSGYASISYLKEIAFDRVKIDGGLIADVIVSPKIRRLVQGMLQLCAAIDLPATAEKVENESQLAVVVGLGCDRVQGHFLSRPLNATGARRLAARGASHAA